MTYILNFSAESFKDMTPSVLPAAMANPREIR